MPKNIDYSKSVIYKLCCKDPSIEDFYVGSTTNFIKRKAQHKTTCNNENIDHHNCYKYQFIRDNGGWNNWDMILIKYYPTDSKRNLEMEERRIIEELKPTLNKQLPTRDKKEYYENNKEYFNEKKKIYTQNNKEKVVEYLKEYRKINKEKLTEKNKIYRENNKEIINDKRKEKTTCPICGSIVRKSDLKKHQRTKKCLNHQ